jgi:hypothetical protein
MVAMVTPAAAVGEQSERSVSVMGAGRQQQPSSF